MFFSIIIPAFNAEKTIEYALSSVQKQSFTDFEVIIIDDGSTDNTQKICVKFSNYDSRFKYYRQTNKGASASRNRGLLEAKGTFITFIDADDLIPMHYLSEFFSLASNNIDCDNYWCGINYCSVANNIQLNTLNFPKLDCLFDSKKNILSLQQYAPYNAMCNKIFKRDILIKNQIFMPEDLSLGEDLIFNLRYLDCTNGKIAINPSPLYVYCTNNENSLDRKFRSDLLEIYNRIDSELLDYLVKWNVDSSQMEIYHNSVLFHKIKVLYNTYRSECPLSRIEKLRYNSKLIRSNEFKKALENSTASFHPLYRIAYKIGSWQMIRFLDYLVKIKKRFKGSD